MIYTLGSLRLATSAFTRPKPLLLLCYLSLEGPQPCRHLAELFFREARDPNDALSTTLRRLKGASGRVGNEDGMVSCSLPCDAGLVLQHLDNAQLEQALALYKAPFLQSFTVSLPVELEEWVYAMREHLAERVREAHLQLAEGALAQTDLSRVADHAERAYALPAAPELEPGDLQRLYALLQAAGSPRAAELQRQATQFGIELLPYVPAAFPVTPLQAPTDDAPATPTPAGSRPPSTPPASISHNLSAPLTLLVGRDMELVEIAKAIAEPGCRLLTIHGPGGVGKTRLALQAAYEQLYDGSAFTGVYFVDLDVLTNSDQIPNAIASALQQPPLKTDDPWQELAGRLGEWRMLLVLDNFEHLSEGVMPLNTLLRGAPGTSLLVTSRERLNLEAEWLLTLSGLPIPAADVRFEEALAVDAVKLFVQRAKRNDVRFTLSEDDLPHVRAVCRQVDGFPLGIELAAASLRLTPLAALAGALEQGAALESSLQDVAVRHRSLTATLEHSWQLLSSKEQQVLRKLSVFYGGFRREAAAEVAGATIATLVSLVDKSFLRARPNGRFDRHVLVHQFTRAKLTEHPDEAQAAREKHGRYYTRLLVESQRKRDETAPKPFFVLIEEEESNLLACLGWAATDRQAEVINQLAEPLMWYFLMRGRLRDGEAAFAQAIAALPDTTAETQRALANLLVGQAYFSRYGGNLDHAAKLATRAVRCARAAGSALELIRALDVLGQVEQFEGRHAEATEHLTEAVRLAREQGNALQASIALRNLSRAESFIGDFARAEAHAREAVSLFERDLKDRRDIGHVALQTLGVALYSQRDWAGAREIFLRSLTIVEAGGHQGITTVTRALLADTLFELGMETNDAGLVEAARRCCQELQPIVDASGESMGRSLLLGMLARLDLFDNRLAVAERRAREAVGIAWSSNNPTIFFWVLPWLAEAYLARDKVAQACTLVGMTRHHAAAPAWVKAWALRLQDELALQLEEVELERYLREGQALSLPVAVDALIGLVEQEGKDR